MLVTITDITSEIDTIIIVSTNNTPALIHTATQTNQTCTDVLLTHPALRDCETFHFIYLFHIHIHNIDYTNTYGTDKGNLKRLTTEVII